MAKLHYFYPEHDLALANDTPSFTAPAAAVSLRRSGSTLGLWTGNPGDQFVTDGVNAHWYHAVCEAFGLQVQPYDGHPQDFIPDPWGWSRAVCSHLRAMGFKDNQLPDNEKLDLYRSLSHRRTALALSQALGGNGVCATSAEEVLETVHRFGRAMLKLPWSSSGRGVYDTRAMTDDDIARQASGTIRRQGAIMVEPYHVRALDFALLYTLADGHAAYDGLSVFRTDGRNAYAGNMVAEKEILQTEVNRFTSGITHGFLEKVAAILESLLEGYVGPLSVDLLADTDGAVHVCEINLRHTMGRVAQVFAQRYLAPGTVADFNISAHTPVFPGNFCVGDFAVVTDSRLQTGSITLSPPDAPLAFTVTVR